MLRGAAHVFKGFPMGPEVGAPTVLISPVDKPTDRRVGYKELLTLVEESVRRGMATDCKTHWLDRDNKGCEAVLSPAMIQEIDLHCLKVTRGPEMSPGG